MCNLIVMICRMKKEMTSKMRNFVSNTKDSKCSLLFIHFQLLYLGRGFEGYRNLPDRIKLPQRPEALEAKTHGQR